MRYMILVKASPESEAGEPPDPSRLAAMRAYHDELAKAGVLLDFNGLRPSGDGWRVQYSGDGRRVIDGPFADGAGLVAGYTLVQVRTREEALEWSRRYPNPRGEGKECAIEVRRVFEPEEAAALAAAGQVHPTGDMHS